MMPNKSKNSSEMKQEFGRSWDFPGGPVFKNLRVQLLKPASHN